MNQTKKLFRVLVDGIVIRTNEIKCIEILSDIFNVTNEGVCLDESKFHNFPIDYIGSEYFEWSENIEQKLKEFHSIQITDENIENFYGFEKRLVFCEINVTKMLNEFDLDSYDINLLNDESIIDYYNNYEWVEIKHEINMFF